MSKKQKTPLDPQLLARARQMRREAAPAEQLLWSFLRDRQLAGRKFRRQAPLGSFIADFYCQEVDLAIELDGASHLDRQHRDQVRTEILQRDGHHVIRFWNTDVFENLAGVLEAIHGECERLGLRKHPHPNPLPEGEGVIAQAVSILRGGGIVAFPTETVYGLGADATNAAAVRRVFDVKGRPPTNPCIVHVADADVARRYAAAWPPSASQLVERFWPGPLTIILPKANAIAPMVTAGRSTAGLRCPDHPLALRLLREFDGPLIGPSANRSTHLSPTTADHVRQELGDAVDLILDGGHCRFGIESTVLDLTTEVPSILRPGALSREQIQSVIGPVSVLRAVMDAGEPAKAPGQQPVHYAPRTQAYRFEAWQRNRVPTGGCGIMELGDKASLHRHGTIVRMPRDPLEYARHIYAVLRELDAMQLEAIYVEMPPDEPAWLAVCDRLIRATKPIRQLSD